MAIVGWLVIILQGQYKRMHVSNCTITPLSPTPLSILCLFLSTLPPSSFLPPLLLLFCLLHSTSPLPLPSLPYLLSLFSPTPPSLTAPPPSEVVAEKNTQPKHSEQSKVPSGQNILFIYSMQLDLHNIN